MARPTGYNNLTVEIYSSGTTRIPDVDNIISTLSGISFDTFYPGGIYGPMSFHVPRDVADSWQIRGPYRVVVRNDLTIVWEGQIVDQDRVLGDTAQGITISCDGYWGQLIAKRTWNKPWADNRLSEYIQTTNFQVDKFDLRSESVNRRKAMPKDGISYSNGDKVEFGFYQMPTGETVKRITFSYNLQEAAQAWKLALWNNTSSADEWSVTASGSGSVDQTLATPDDNPGFYFASAAAQTGIGNDTIYGIISDIITHSETGSINPTEVVKDIRAKITQLNSTEVFIGSNTLGISPFITNGYEKIDSILARVMAYGDASQNSWAAWLFHSELSPSPDGKPVLLYTQYPSLTATADYLIRLDEENLRAPFTVVTDYDGIRNWIVVSYTDVSDNRTKWVTPDDDATLKDTTSITNYGERHLIVNGGATSAAGATNIGKRYLAALKNPRYYVSGPINVVGYLRNKYNQKVGVSGVYASATLKIEDFVTDESGTGLTVLITGTHYDDDSETCSLSVGVPDDLAVFLAQIDRGIISP